MGIWSSGNGGRSWTHIWPPAPSVVQAAAGGLAFGLAWTGGSRAVMESTGGGGAWTALASLPGSVSSIAAPDGRAVYALVTIGKSVELLASRDGGARWSRRAAPPTPHPNGLSFPTAQTGFLYGANGTIYRTENGGQTWTRTGSTPAQSWFQPAVFTSSKDGWAVTGTRALYATRDAGARWAVAGLAPGSGIAVSFANAADGALLIGDTAACAFPSRCTVSLLVTTDGGAHWSLRPLRGIEATGVTMASSTRIYVTTLDGALVTTDGGATWSWAG